MTRRQLKETLLTGKPRSGSGVFSFSIIVFMMIVTWVYWENLNGVKAYLPISGKSFYEGEYWRAITAIFIHSDFEHIFANSYMLLFFSFLVYGYFGPIVYPFITVLGAAIVNVLTVSTYRPEVNLLGASGLVYLLGGFWLTMYLLIQRQYEMKYRVLRVLGFAAIVFFPSTFTQTTSYKAHALGFIFGIVIAIGYFILQRSQIRSHEEWEEVYEEEPPSH